MKTKRKPGKPSFILTVERIIYATSTSLYNFLLVHTHQNLKLLKIKSPVHRDSSSPRGDPLGATEIHPGEPRRPSTRAIVLPPPTPFLEYHQNEQTKDLYLRGETSRIRHFDEKPDLFIFVDVLLICLSFFFFFTSACLQCKRHSIEVDCQTFRYFALANGKTRVAKWPEKITVQEREWKFQSFVLCNERHSVHEYK